MQRNRMDFWRGALLLLACCAGAQAFADTEPAKPILNDLTNYQGDRILFEDDLLVSVQATDGTRKGWLCLPRRTRLKGEYAYSVDKEVGTLFRIPKKFSANAACDPTRLPTKKPDGDEIRLGIVAEGTLIRVTHDQLVQFPPDRYGLAYGVLAVPFKYHFTGNKAFTGSGTVGPYLGYRTTRDWFSLQYIGFIAASNIPVAQTVNGKQTTQNIAGLSYGGGVVATIKGSFQVGAVLGWDRVATDANYQYNGKAWLAVELGYSFLQ
jgi:hypothetical protein